MNRFSPERYYVAKPDAYTRSEGVYSAWSIDRGSGIPARAKYPRNMLEIMKLYGGIYIEEEKQVTNSGAGNIYRRIDTNLLTHSQRVVVVARDYWRFFITSHHHSRTRWSEIDFVMGLPKEGVPPLVGAELHTTEKGYEYTGPILSVQYSESGELYRVQYHMLSPITAEEESIHSKSSGDIFDEFVSICKIGAFDRSKNSLSSIVAFLSHEWLRERLGADQAVERALGQVRISVLNYTDSLLTRGVDATDVTALQEPLVDAVLEYLYRDKDDINLESFKDDPTPLVTKWLELFIRFKVGDYYRRIRESGQFWFSFVTNKGDHDVFDYQIDSGKGRIRLGNPLRLDNDMLALERSSAGRLMILSSRAKVSTQCVSFEPSIDAASAVEIITTPSTTEWEKIFHEPLIPELT